MKREKTNQRNLSRFVSLAVVVLLMLVGTALLIYPTVADKVNGSLNEHIIADYQEKVQSLGNEEYQNILNAAREYNEKLALHTPYIGELTAKDREMYNNLLDVTGTGLIGYIEVKKSNVYLGIYHGTDENILQTAVGHLETSSLPVTGESVHTVLTGHSGLPSARLFTDLDKLRIGDIFKLHILNETLTYQVENIRRVSPDELKNLRIERGQELCTLMTCTPYGINTHRLLIIGRRIETPLNIPEDDYTTDKVITSTWNQRFIFIPAVIFAAIAAAVIVIYKKAKKRKHKK